MKVLSDILHKAGILKDNAEAYSSGGYSVFVRNSSTQRVETVPSSSLVPSQSGNSGKYLTTDGNNLSWGTVSTSNIYTADGTLTGNRTVSTTSGYTLTFNPVTTFTENLTISKNQNAETALEIKNTTSGTTAYPVINFYNNVGKGASIAKWSSGATAYKILEAGGFNFFSTNQGNINFLNDFVSGGFRWAAGQSSTAHMSLFSTGNFIIGGTTDAGFKTDIIGSTRSQVYFTNYGTSSVNLLNSGETAQTADRGIFIGGGTFNNSSVVAVSIGIGVTIGTGTGSVAIGYNANASGGGVAIGSPAGNGASSTGGVAISGSSGAQGIALSGTVSNGAGIALKGTASGANAIAIGNATSASGNYSISFGDRSSTANTASIALGLFATSTASRQFIIGGNDVSNTYSINDVYIGGGVQDLNLSNGTSVSINSSGGNGTDKNGGNITIAGGKGTGTGTPGDVIFASSTATTTGTTLQSLTNRWWIKGGSGALSNVSSPSSGYVIDSRGLSKFENIFTYSSGSSSQALTAVSDITFASGASINSGSFVGSFVSNGINTFNGSLTIPNSVIMSSQLLVQRLKLNSTGMTATFSQSGTAVRAVAGQIQVVQITDDSTTGTVSHAAGIQFLAPYKNSGNQVTISNYYGIAINPSDEYSTQIAITNRWGIYQSGTTDNNWFAGKVIIGSTNTVGSSNLNVKNLPTSSAGLSSGDVWNDSGTLKIV